MQKLNKQDIIDILYGCAVLGTGGGGNLQAGIDMMQEDFDAGRTLNLIDVKDLPDDCIVATPYGCGAPSASTREPEYNPDRKLTRIEYPPAVLAFQSLEEFLGKKIYAVSSTELGGMNTAEALHIACLLNRPLVDADPAGRSVPELIHSTFYLKDRPIHPMAVATWFGDVIILKEVADDFRAEALVRSMACVSGDEVSVCDHPMTGDQYRRSVIPGAISYAWKIGKILRKTKEDGCDAAQAIAEAAGGAVLFRGRVKNLFSQCRDGFDCGETLLEGTGSYAGETYRIQFKNENLIACRNDKTDVTVPDLICMVDKNGNPMTNPDFSPGDEMNVFALPAPEIWTGEDGLKILGPSYFGIDEPYIPFQQRTR